MALQATDILPPGHRLHWYEIQSLLGYGGFGITYLSRDTNLNQSVAIKEFFPQSYVRRGDNFHVVPGAGINANYYHWGLERFLDEARTLARFRHANIVRVLSVFEGFGTAYMIMELERGHSLGDAIRQGQMGGDNTVLDVCIPIMDGLQLIHQAGFIHRDIKPGNILLREDNAPVLIDFGSARQPHPNAQDNLTAIVSRGYAPFEQYDAGNEEKQGSWSDIYGLAATLYHTVTRAAPVDAMTRAMALLNDDPDPLIPASQRAEGLYSPQLLAAIDAGLIVRASERPQNIRQWRTLFPEHQFENQHYPRVRTEALNIPSRRKTGEKHRHTATQQLRAAAATPTATNGDTTQKNPHGPSKLAAACRSWSFLVVDDNLSDRSFAARVLSKLGASRVMTATSAQQAMECLQTEELPDIILCDLIMPETDGIQFLRQLAAAGIKSGLILAGDDDSRLLTAAEGIARNHHLHVLGSINKPLNPHHLERLLLHMHTYRERTARERAAVNISDEELKEMVLSGDRSKLVYLPKIALSDQRLLGAEALSRWTGVSGSRAILQTIARIEAMGLDEQFSQHVFSQALAQAGAWRAEGLQAGISINVYAGMLNQTQLPDTIVAMAQSEGLNPANVMLEVNEVRFEDECAAPLEVLTRLRLRKMGLSLDDFGTGTSTFERLRQLPVSEIKVDRSIVSSALNDPTSRAILESSVALAKRLDLQVVAEGVEDERTLELVSRIGCHAAQGYLISPPVEGDELADWASDWQAGHNVQTTAPTVTNVSKALD